MSERFDLKSRIALVVERSIVELYLKRFKDNRERVAKELGVARSTLFKRLKDWGMTGSHDD